MGRRGMRLAYKYPAWYGILNDTKEKISSNSRQQRELLRIILWNICLLLIQRKIWIQKHCRILCKHFFGSKTWDVWAVGNYSMELSAVAPSLVDILNYIFCLVSYKVPNHAQYLCANRMCLRPIDLFVSRSTFAPNFWNARYMA